MRLLAAHDPAMGALHCSYGVFPVGGIRGAFVERHGDIRAKGFLYLHYKLGGEEMLTSVQKGAELHAVLFYFIGGGEAEHLKAAAVGKYGLVPPHELVQAARLFYKLVTGPLKEVICV